MIITVRRSGTTVMWTMLVVFVGLVATFVSVYCLWVMRVTALVVKEDL